MRSAVGALLFLALLAPRSGESATAAKSATPSKKSATLDQSGHASAKTTGEQTKPKKLDPDSLFKSDTFSGLAFRGIGPATTSGRITDVAVHPTDRSIWYVAA